MIRVGNHVAGAVVGERAAAVPPIVYARGKGNRLRARTAIAVRAEVSRIEGRREGIARLRVLPLPYQGGTIRGRCRLAVDRVVQNAHFDDRPVIVDAFQRQFLVTPAGAGACASKIRCMRKPTTPRELAS